MRCQLLTRNGACPGRRLENGATTPKATRDVHSTAFFGQPVIGSKERRGNPSPEPFAPSPSPGRWAHRSPRRARPIRGRPGRAAPSAACADAAEGRGNVTRAVSPVCAPAGAAARGPNGPGRALRPPERTRSARVPVPVTRTWTPAPTPAGQVHDAPRDKPARSNRSSPSRTAGSRAPRRRPSCAPRPLPPPGNAARAGRPPRRRNRPPRSRRGCVRRRAGNPSPPPAGRAPWIVDGERHYLRRGNHGRAARRIRAPVLPGTH
ncbi:hypothetical protein HNQ79_004161 [Streptomyces candidus]|uniref:Uncharacterized protein n=1 Tax=Streptomyces candidus TaxID=67283 RepID=A0A7X0HHG2_9ACTN|nr:hypothetical protein [Streptomyces candidus]